MHSLHALHREGYTRSIMYVDDNASTCMIDGIRRCACELNGHPGIWIVPSSQYDEERCSDIGPIETAEAALLTMKMLNDS